MTKPAIICAETGARVTAHALYIGDRINTMGFEGEVLSALPLAVQVGKAGVAMVQCDASHPGAVSVTIVGADGKVDIWMREESHRTVRCEDQSDPV